MPNKWTTEAGLSGRIEHHMQNPLRAELPGATIETGMNYNGSGPQAFGGAVSWPVAKIRIAFPPGREDLRDGYVEALKVFTENFFVGLETNTTTRAEAMLPVGCITNDGKLVTH